MLLTLKRMILTIFSYLKRSIKKLSVKWKVKTVNTFNENKKIALITLSVFTSLLSEIKNDKVNNIYIYILYKKLKHLCVI